MTSMDRKIETKNSMIKTSYATHFMDKSKNLMFGTKDSVEVMLCSALLFDSAKSKWIARRNPYFENENKSRTGNELEFDKKINSYLFIFLYSSSIFSNNSECFSFDRKAISRNSSSKSAVTLVAN